MNDSEKPKSSWRERRQSIKHKWLVPFIFPEWFCERVSYFLGQWAFLEILGHAGRLTILIAVIFYFMEADERRMEAENQRKAKQYQAWQVISAAQGKPGDGGRTNALQDLNQDKISLVGVDISGAQLSGIKLENANLRGSNLSNANLSEANLRGADLCGANLYKTDFSGADLSNAKLSTPDICLEKHLDGTERYLSSFHWDDILKGPSLQISAENGQPLTHAADADFSGANLSGANLSNVNFRGARLSDANLRGANLTGAALYLANVRRADLRMADLKGTDLDPFSDYIQGANIYGVKNPHDGFIEWAIEHGAVSIEDDKEWNKLLREKEQEKTKEK